MTSKERRAFVSGYRHALRRARRELAEMAERWDVELAGLDDKLRAEHQQTVRDIGDELVGLIVEMRGMRDEFHRLKAVEAAIDVERDPNTLLN
jgi:predicted  nucleic acid-binding Zn-ribbon protein